MVHPAICWSCRTAKTETVSGDEAIATKYHNCVAMKNSQNNTMHGTFALAGGVRTWWAGVTQLQATYSSPPVKVTRVVLSMTIPLRCTTPQYEMIAQRHCTRAATASCGPSTVPAGSTPGSGSPRRRPTGAHGSIQCILAAGCSFPGVATDAQTLAPHGGCNASSPSQQPQVTTAAITKDLPRSGKTI